jgi:hypothetical protein
MRDAISKMPADFAPRAQVELRLPRHQDGDDADQDRADELERLEDGKAVRLIRDAISMQSAQLGPLHPAKLRVRWGCDQHAIA